MFRISVMTVCLLAAAGSIQAEDFRVLEDVDGATPQEMMARYLLKKAQTALDQREEGYGQLKTPDNWPSGSEISETTFLQLWAIFRSGHR